MMNRRQALQAMMGALGLASTAQVFGARVLFGDVPAHTIRPVLTDSEVKLLDEVAETILPETPDSPGAKAAKVGEFMQEMVSAYYDLLDQQIFLNGLATFQQRVTERYSASFLSVSASQRKEFLLTLEQDSDATYYQMIKQLAVWGYFSSEVGVKQALRFAPIPGRYDGQVKIEPGTTAWANIGGV
ncbi:gluconate 2-dehydrogenase subunit 3 family protein [Marinimicrobium sp. ABcell2]|uniref:gluconate 2-dehydrogenase subunit 3 family protein n=1 Tax=Marinimicrobium sp. ABcell2 TaxID=3069751 RepID=UPI0027B2CE9C|nr:gluconate 2-dehydrogenase subunit 3 family protein [Marinimicrobium sp. ABcell2]MDQ2077061.1 gluconate 2-dehydrogenase subunit 3 family protein [Marinimicrobium sp. ABcell2]